MVAAARNGFASWSRTATAERAAIMHRAAALVREQDTLAPLMSREMGKPIKQAIGEVASVAELIDYFAEGLQGERRDPEARPSERTADRGQGAGRRCGGYHPLQLSDWAVVMEARSCAGVRLSMVAKPTEYAPSAALRLQRTVSRPALQRTSSR